MKIWFRLKWRCWIWEELSVNWVNPHFIVKHIPALKWQISILSCILSTFFDLSMVRLLMKMVQYMEGDSWFQPCVLVVFLEASSGKSWFLVVKCWSPKKKWTSKNYRMPFKLTQASDSARVRLVSFFYPVFCLNVATPQPPWIHWRDWRWIS